MVSLLDTVKTGDKSLVMKRNIGYFQYFQVWATAAVSQRASWGWTQNKLLSQLRTSVPEVLAQTSPSLSNRLVSRKTDCWRPSLRGPGTGPKTQADQVYKDMLWTAIFSIICKKMISGMKKLKYNRRYIFFSKRKPSYRSRGPRTAKREDALISHQPTAAYSHRSD